MEMERIVLAMRCGRNHIEVFVVNKPAFRIKEVLILSFEYAWSV